MKKLLGSSKFWAITIGAILGSALYYFLGDGVGLSSNFPMLVVGAYGAIGFAGEVGKAGAKIMHNNKED